MDRNQDENLNDRLPNSGLDRSGVPASNSSSESLLGDSQRTSGTRGDATVDVDRDAG